MESEINVEIVEKKRFRKYKFTNKKHSRGGIFSTLLAIVAAVFFTVGVYISFKAGGDGDIIVGVLGMLSFIFSLYGFIKGIQSFKVEDCFYGFSWLGTVLNAVIWICIASITVMGF